jgi:hypothetical protein
MNTYLEETLRYLSLLRGRVAWGNIGAMGIEGDIKPKN